MYQRPVSLDSAITCACGTFIPVRFYRSFGCMHLTVHERLVSYTMKKIRRCLTNKHVHCGYECIDAQVVAKSENNKYGATQKI